MPLDGTRTLGSCAMWKLIIFLSPVLLSCPPRRVNDVFNVIITLPRIGSSLPLSNLYSRVSEYLYITAPHTAHGRFADTMHGLPFCITIGLFY